MKANLDGLDPGQRELWPELARTPGDFVLYGGVALSLRYNHRHSADFDFFCRQTFDPQELKEGIPYLASASVLQLRENTLTCLIQRAKPVKLSFFGLPRFGQAEAPEVEEGIGLKIASTLDIAATKASVLQKRSASRDYLDMDVLLTRAHLKLPQILKAASLVYGSSFNPHITLKALAYFGDGDLGSLDRKSVV